MGACPESPSWTQYKVAQAYVAMFKTWSNENCTEASSVLFALGVLELMEWRSLNKVPQSASLWLVPWDAPGQRFCPAVLQRFSQMQDRGLQPPQPPGLNRQYLKISEGLKTCCSNCRGGREEHALNELWICTVLQHGSHPSCMECAGWGSLCRAPLWGEPGAAAVPQPAAERGQIPLGWKHQAHVTF